MPLKYIPLIILLLQFSCSIYAELRVDIKGVNNDGHFKTGMILVAVGTPDSIRRISEISHPITKQGPVVVVGFGDVGNKLVEMLQAAGETVCVVANEEADGVDVVGDILDTDVYDHADVLNARVVILTCEEDNTSVLASTVLRNYAPDVPMIGYTQLEETVGRCQQAGVDFAISVSEVFGQLLAHHILGDMVSRQSHVKLVKLAAGNLAGLHPSQNTIHDMTGCAIIGIVRNNAVILNFPESFRVEETDDIYFCGLTGSFQALYQEMEIT